MKFEALNIRNYKCLGSVDLFDLPSMAVFIGANGSGKSTLQDVLAFLQDCLRMGVNEACERRGGFHELQTRGAIEPISIGLTYFSLVSDEKLRYQLEITQIGKGGIATSECLEICESEQRKNLVLFKVSGGVGNARRHSRFDDIAEAERLKPLEIDSKANLALQQLAQSGQYLHALVLSFEIEKFGQLSFDSPSQSRPRFVGGSSQGMPLARRIQFLRTEYPYRHEELKIKLRSLVPDLEDLVVERGPNGEGLILRFIDKDFAEPISLQGVSDGTVKLLEYLLFCLEPATNGVLTVDRPESHLYPETQSPMAEELRGFAQRGNQVFVATHSPDFVNGVKLEELYWLEKQNGLTVVKRAKDDPEIVSRHQAGDLLGRVWAEW